MPTSRLEAFSDGVLAIIITIMVLELHRPTGSSFSDLADSGTAFATYVLSFVYVGIYWNNHHHVFQLVQRVNGSVLWANLNLLFWLSLFPFTTGWMDETGLARIPVVVYGINLFAAAASYYLLQVVILRAEGASGLYRDALGADFKGKISPALYLVGIAASAWVSVWLGLVLYAVVAVMWMVPDRRLEALVADHGTNV